MIKINYTTTNIKENIMTLKSTKFAGQTINVSGEIVSFDESGSAEASEKASQSLARSRFIDYIKPKSKPAPTKKSPATSTKTTATPKKTTTTKTTTKKAPAKSKEEPKED